MEHETFWDLIQNLAHWEFELFLMFLFDVVIGLMIWPRIKGWKKHHRNDHREIDQLERSISLLEMRCYWLEERMNKKDS